MLTVLTPPTTSDLTTVAAAARELMLAQDAQFAGLDALIRQASAICARHCARPEGFGRATVRQTERLARRTDCIVLDRDLAPAIASVTEGGVALSASAYELDGARLFRLSDDRRVPWQPVSVVVTYDAGYALPGSVPGDLERACLLLMQAMFSARGRDPLLRSESAEGVGAVAYLDPRSGVEALPPQVGGLLDAWLRVSV